MSHQHYILVLPSWYPNRYDQFTGDFNQRHCIAFSKYRQIVVVKVVGHCDVKQQETVRVQRNDNLLEILVYFPKRRTPVLKWLNPLREYLLYKKTLKTLIRERGKPQAIHSMVVYNGGVIAALLKRWIKVPLLISEHWTIFYNADPAYSILNKPVKRKLFQYAFSRADLFLPVCERLEKEAKKNFRLPSTEILPNVVDTSKFFYKEKENSRLKLLHVSTMYRQKNIAGIIRSVALLERYYPDFELTIVGQPSEELLTALEDYPGIRRRIQMAGEIPYERVAELMQEHHILVLFSWYENLPCVILEALCCGLVVVSSDVGGIAEVIDDTNGILVEPGDEVALSAAMHRVLTNYSNYLPARIAADARGKFSYEKVGKDMHSVYDRILSEK
jgi:glycosyltransferase involved in cell wall biosynthesis